MELASRYGSRATLIEAVIEEAPELAAPLSAGCPVLAAEAVHAARSEMAARLEDFMLRRTTMARHFPALAAGAAAKAARLMGSELGWNDERVAAELAQFSAALKAIRVV